LLKTTFEEWNADNAARLAAALAYYTIFSLAPLLVIVVSVAGIFYGREAAQGQLVQEVERYVPNAEAAELIQTAVENARVPETSLFATLAGFALLIWGATGVFGELRNALNNIWDVPPKKNGGVWGIVVDRLLPLVMVLIGGGLMLVALVASTALSAATSWMNRLSPEAVVWTQAINFVFFLIVTLILFLLVYKFVPDVPIAWSDVWPGALATAILFSVGRLLIGWYLAQSSVASAYGAASSLALLLLYTYYSAQVFFLGAEFTQVYGRTYGTRRSEHRLIEEPIPAVPQQTVASPDGTIVPVPSAANPAAISAATEGMSAEGASAESREAPRSTAHDAEETPLPPKRPRLERLRRLVRPLGEVGAAIGVIALLSVVNLVGAPIRRDRNAPAESSPPSSPP
jgi:membrane protein